MTRIVLAALLSTAVVLPAAAQGGRQVVAEKRFVAAGLEPVTEQNYAPGLPGVALDASRATDRPSGPGGLSNGVGAVGTLMPNSSSSNGQLLDDGGNGIGFPLSVRRRGID